MNAPLESNLPTVSRVSEEANAFDNPKVTHREKAAAGIPGVLHAMQHAIPARGLLPLINMNKHGGVDCPGCAWPEPNQKDLNIVEFCENGAKAVAEETTPDRATADFWAAHTISDLQNQTDHWLGKQGRITEPMYYDRASGDEHYRPISWEKAISLISEQLKKTDPKKAVFYTSGRASNEAAYTYQLLARRLGSNNLPDCGNLCHESTGSALSQTLGLGKGSITMNDLETTDLYFSVGQNPGTNHPRSLTSFTKMKENGGKMVVLNPMPETGLMAFKEPQSIKGGLGIAEKLADEYLQVRLDGDRAFFQQLNRELIRRDAIDHVFIEKFTSGFEETVEHLMSLDDAELERGSNISAAKVSQIADMVEKAGSVIVGWTLGATQHKSAVATLREIVNFLLLTGNIGKPGAGTAPFRGHSNVQGNRTVGIWEKMPKRFMDALQDYFGFDVPREFGLDTVDSLRQMRDGENQFFMSLGGNLVRVASDTSACERAMTQQEMTVHLSTKPNGSHAWPGEKSLILPVLARTDVDMQKSGPQQITVENSAGVVSASIGKRTANKDLNLKSEVDIICSIGRETFGDDFWQPMIDDYSVIRDAIEGTIPGFERYNERMKKPGGFYLPNGPRQRVFNTSDGKAHLTVNQPAVLEVPENHFLMSTVRSHDQFNSTMYGLNDRYRGIHNGRRVVFMHKDDIAAQGMRNGDLVDIVSVWEDGERRAPNFRVVEYDHARGCVSTYLPEANVLVPLDSTADESNTPVYKSVLVRLEPLGKNAADA
ncbi:MULTISPECIES: FdhF/YdeP family oxidoreductase [unclassified Rothia (in: high G+C Gram-positive bacteria)]|uniref:FdhF/YdeP family oxidoreductase n=1 Tax=unclassified Rothia (in: high G+C Gram-positive bacteria) TaxID=2689056 RepID=UPI00195D60FB|nr:MULTISPECIES: FdhF/YdeP family oxidoreductase [unclassified Rothia (in: high G+C Gram-positive bacteria)]MBM7051673.1 FdhF/YdeP family oxidoreductase [Rothia sp. ZJ1223]QRZ61689.1 FdhF/YdeP family oxidoreductase [Rothia sp. ZJ932]